MHKTYAGTGSRGLTGSEERHVRKWLTEFLEPQDVVEMVISGMAPGFDIILAEVAIDLGLPLTAAVPYPRYDQDYWSDDPDRFLRARGLAHQVEVVSRTKHVGDRHANFVRNDWMVDHCDALVTYDKGTRGTSATLAVAAMRQRPIIRIPLLGETQ